MKLFFSFLIPFIFLMSCSSSTNNEGTKKSTENPESSIKKTVPAEIETLLQKNTCLSCHSATERIVGPPYKEVAKRNYTNEEIVALIYQPKPEHWPEYLAPMLPLTTVPKEEAQDIPA